MSGKIRKTIVTQIGILTPDIYSAKKAWEQFLGLPEQPVTQSEGFAKTSATYGGEPMHGQIFQVCFNFENIELELIQPIGETPSYWRECLLKNGAGVHHISFAVKDMAACVAECEQTGMRLTQQGDFPGGKYAYLDATDSMQIVLELLEKEEEVF